MMPLPGYDPAVLKGHILRAYNTAQTLLRDAVALDAATDFLRHAPHFYFRALLCAACTLCKVVRSTHKSLLDRAQVEQSAADILALTKKAVILEGDLATRLAHLMEPWLQPALDQPEWDEDPVSSFTRRLAAGPTLDCLLRWKHDHEVNNAKSQQLPPPDGADGSSSNLTASADPMQFIDWSFMDDFDWNFETSILPGGS